MLSKQNPIEIEKKLEVLFETSKDSKNIIFEQHNDVIYYLYYMGKHTDFKKYDDFMVHYFMRVIRSAYKVDPDNNTLIVEYMKCCRYARTQQPFLVLLAFVLSVDDVLAFRHMNCCMRTRMSRDCFVTAMRMVHGTPKRILSFIVDTPSHPFHTVTKSKFIGLTM